MYLAGIALFAATLWFFRRPTLGHYAFLGALSGLVAFVRPTLLCYGFVSTFLAWLLTRLRVWNRARSWVAPGFFGLGCGLLFLTNAYRFGSGLEFGHQLNLNVHLPMMYATRFEESHGRGAAVSKDHGTLFLSVPGAQRDPLLRWIHASDLAGPGANYPLA